MSVTPFISKADAEGLRQIGHALGDFIASLALLEHMETGRAVMTRDGVVDVYDFAACFSEPILVGFVIETTNLDLLAGEPTIKAAALTRLAQRQSAA